MSTATATTEVTEVKDPETVAADFLTVDDLLKRVTAKREAIRKDVIASFTAAGITEAGGVLCSESFPRSANIKAALRLKDPEAVEAVTERKTSVALAEAARDLNIITQRQFNQIVTKATEPQYTVQPQTVKVPTAVAKLVTAA